MGEVTERLRVLVADDELLARQRLVRLLSAMPAVVVAGECESGSEVLARCAAGGIDVLLLDVQMPGLTGLEALELLPEGAPLVIFCTAHADHAVRAFDAGAVDYLLKPIEAARLQKALERAGSREAQRRFAEELARHARPAAQLPRLALQTRQGIVLIDPEQVSHAVLDGELVTLHAKGGAVLCDQSLQELQEKLPSDRFVRAHRRALLNLACVLRLEPLETGGFLALMQDGDRVEVSRQAARDLRKRLGLRKGPEE